MIKFDFSTYTGNFITNEELGQYNITQDDLKKILESYKEYMGWYDADNLFDKRIIEDINKTASYIKENCDVFLIIGIGGSYLGSKAIIDALSPYFYNQTTKPEIYYVGTNLSSDYYNDLINLIKDKNIIVNVISKSGETIETKAAYQLIMDLMRTKYSEEELKNRVIITTSSDKGMLRQEVIRYGYKSLIIPNDIGGRYSVFTPVGLLPLAVKGVDLNTLYEGIKEANSNLSNQIRYAIIRNIMFKKGKYVEAYVTYEPKLKSLLEWLKQLYGESLGKNGKGILPISYINTRDLHSLGQFIQQGNMILFETVINILNSKSNINIKEYSKSLNEVNNIALVSTVRAHYNGNVLNNIITIDDLDEKTIGYLMQFFMMSCTISGYIEGVNPFNQEGVEEYKNIIKGML